MNENTEDEDRGFEYKSMNEIKRDDEKPFFELEGKPYEEIRTLRDGGNENARRFLEIFDNYEITVVKLSESREPEEFNLQFTRLNLGTPINSGEKLHAMVGDLRDVCFNEIGKHPFLEATHIPTRRYAREQVAAQILGQVFSLAKGDGFTRTRYFDLQRLFKQHTSLDAKQLDWISRVHKILDLLEEAFTDVSILKNRALTVSTVLLAWELDQLDGETAREVAKFLEEFLCRLNWQLGKGYDFDNEYRYLIDFQRHVTQGSVEKPAVEGRARVLKEQFEHWKKTNGKLRGDAEYKGDASAECRDDSS